MAFDAYIEIADIPGEVLDDKHKGWIEVLGYEFGATQATSATATSSGGASAEGVVLSDFSICKVVDSASPKLFEACCKGTHFKEVTLSVNRAGGKKVAYLTIAMEQVLISSVKSVARRNRNGGDNAISDLPLEEISFNYARIKKTYARQSREDGEAAGNISGGWDRTRNQPFA
ncbi:Hcp family type VI secretion system effector [Pseudomonas japonica]|uniref:Hcp family type VI secretion system effector n=1 Tax=Pseudomonas japonica TaxID=256466 RepID=UPI0015E37960|nr:type VI secretion system tube protein Hcp [Pseudomonas japonica]MBA1245062.1 type VI secretion system tube protein Hcp [Pseudomonas japonica]